MRIKKQRCSWCPKNKRSCRHQRARLEGNKTGNLGRDVWQHPSFQNKSVEIFHYELTPFPLFLNICQHPLLILTNQHTGNNHTLWLFAWWYPRCQTAYELHFAHTNTINTWRRGNKDKSTFELNRGNSSLQQTDHTLLSVCFSAGLAVKFEIIVPKYNLDEEFRSLRSLLKSPETLWCPLLDVRRTRPPSLPSLSSNPADVNKRRHESSQMSFRCYSVCVLSWTCFIKAAANVSVSAGCLWSNKDKPDVWMCLNL